MPKKISRSSAHKMVGGVCYGLAAYLDLDPTIVRLIFVALALITAVFPMFIFYVIAWIIIPLEEAEGSEPPPAPVKPKGRQASSRSSSTSSSKKKS